MKKKNKQGLSVEHQVQSINCEQAIARFNDFMDNYLKGKSRKELLHHFSECKHCADRFEFERMLKSKINKLSHSDDAAMKAKIEKLIASL